MAAARETLALYRDLLRKSARFSDYNFRMLARRRVMEKFRENREETDPEKLRALFAEARKSGKMLDRQTTIGEMFSWRPVTIDSIRGSWDPSP